MQQLTKEKLLRRLNHLREVLEDCSGEDPLDMELEALFHSVRDIQPGLCEALRELDDDPRWVDKYRKTILSDIEQKAIGEFLWSEEEE